MGLLRALAPLLLLLASSSAFANGLTTHVWISLEARRHLPEGPLRDLVMREDLADALVSGTIFPDGGYAIGDGYGELAHWEPFQLGYLEWIAARYAPPWSAEAEGHIAFLLGLASHGMADQVFDSLYLTRAQRYDAESDWRRHSVDEATDVVFASHVGAQPVPRRWLPVDQLQAVLEEGAGHRVDEMTMVRGHSLASFAVAIVGMLGEDPEAVRAYRAQFPWATTHLLDPSIPGSPPNEARVVARYWEHLWERLHARAGAEPPVLATVPEDGSLGHTRTATSVEARITVVFARRFLRREVSAEHFRLESSAGRRVPLAIDLFYGNDSHVVHLIPEEDLEPETDYTVTVRPELTFADGGGLGAPFTFSVSTRSPPQAPEAEDPGCGCRSAGAGRGTAGLGLLAALLLWVRRRPRETASTPKPHFFSSFPPGDV